MSSEVIVTYVNIILYAISYQLQRPVEPFLVKSLIHNTDDGQSKETKSNQTFGTLTSFFSFGSPLVGILLDRLGPRRTSILVYLGSAASYAILSQAASPLWLYCSKIPTILQHAFLVGQATVQTKRKQINQNNHHRIVQLSYNQYKRLSLTSSIQQSDLYYSSSYFIFSLQHNTTFGTCK